MGKAQQLSSFVQSFPSFKGKRRLCRLIMKVTGVLKEKNLVISAKAGIFLLPNLVENISAELYINGYYEKGLIKLLEENIPPNGVFLDVGANIGSISIPLASKRPDVKIIAVEASPWIFQILKGNIELNRLSNITAVNFAVFNESGNMVAMYAPKELFGKGSLKAIFTKEAELVETITLDDLKSLLKLPIVDFVKVDVEGFEASVFSGMSQMFRSDKPKIIFEFSQWAETTAGFLPFTAQSIILWNGYTIQPMDDNFKPVGFPRTEVYKDKESNLFASN